LAGPTWMVAPGSPLATIETRHGASGYVASKPPARPGYRLVATRARMGRERSGAGRLCASAASTARPSVSRRAFGNRVPLMKNVGVVIWPLCTRHEIFGTRPRRVGVRSRVNRRRRPDFCARRRVLLVERPCPRTACRASPEFALPRRDSAAAPPVRVRSRPRGCGGTRNAGPARTAASALHDGIRALAEVGIRSRGTRRGHGSRPGHALMRSVTGSTERPGHRSTPFRTVGAR